MSRRLQNHFLLPYLLFFIISLYQTGMISCHELNVLISLLLGQQTEVALVPNRRYLHKMIGKASMARLQSIQNSQAFW